MTKAINFKPDNLKLRWPLKKDDGSELRELTIKMITHGERETIMADEPDEREASIRLAKHCCSLTANEVKRLKMPDWNGLILKLFDLVSKDSHHFFQLMGETVQDLDAPQLLVPIMGGDEQLIRKVTLQVPTLANIEFMAKQENDKERNRYITSACTGLTVAELNQLSCPDWNSLQARINDFLNETADYFRQAI